VRIRLATGKGRPAGDLSVGQRLTRALAPVLALFLVAAGLVHYQTRETARIYASSGMTAQRTLVAAHGMDTAVSEVGSAIRTYLQDREPQLLDHLRTGAAAFRRHHQTFAALAQDPDQKELSDRIATSFDRYLATARLLATQADERGSQMATFDTETARLEELLGPRPGATAADKQSLAKLQAATALGSSVGTLSTELLRYLSGGAAHLEARVSLDSEAVGNALASYRLLKLTSEETARVAEIDPHVTALLDVTRTLVDSAHRTQELQAILQAEQRKLDGALGDELQAPAQEGLEDSGMAMQLGVSQTGTAVLVLFALAVLAALVFGARARRNITRPIAQILEGIEAVADGRKTPRVGPAEAALHDELLKLADRFDHMSDRLVANTVSRQYVDDLVGAIGQCLIVVDNEGRIVRANPAANALLGYGDLELPGRHMDVILTAPMPAGRLAEREVQLLSREGQHVDVLLSARPLDEEGHAAVLYTAIDISARKAAERAVEAAKKEVARLSRQDELTGLPNRRAFEATLHSATELAKRRGTALAVILLDIDDFGSVNEKIGQAAGDEVLRAVSQRLYGCMRSTDVPARFGGDEFAVLLETLADGQDAPLVAGKILDALQRPIAIGDKDVRISCSIGIGVFPTDGATAAVLLKAADQAMYRAKAAGKNCFIAYSAA
jgi:diguanylate cyclase (GGDEF)-like protein/PAS domain S-box-containing protein